MSSSDVAKQGWVITRLNDLTHISEEGLDACLAELRAAVLDHRVRRAAAIRAGVSPESPSLAFTRFVPSAAIEAKPSSDWEPTADTEIEDLPLPQQVRLDLADLKILRLEDIATVGREELQSIRLIGSRRLALIEHWLQNAGLEFRRARATPEASLRANASG